MFYLLPIMFEHYLNSLNLISSNFKDTLEEKCKIFIQLIKKKYKKYIWLIPYVKKIPIYYNLFILLLIISIVIFSNFFINIVLIYFLLDSIILGFLILHNKSLKLLARKLSKNVILINIIYFNLTGSFLSLLFAFFLYFDFNKFLNKIFFKIIETFLCFLSSNLSFISFIYPNINYIDYNTPILSTETQSESSCLT